MPRTGQTCARFCASRARGRLPPVRRAPGRPCGALHGVPFEGLEQARRFALDWLTERRAAVQRLAVVRLHRETGRRDTVAIVDPSELDGPRASEASAGGGELDAGRS